jgi:hypothetical protein
MTTLTPERLANAARAVGLECPPLYASTEIDMESRTLRQHGDMTPEDIDAWVFRNLRPAVKAAGLQIVDTPYQGTMIEDWRGEEYEAKTVCASHRFALALVLAIEWLKENQPEVLAKAVKEVRG